VAVEFHHHWQQAVLEAQLMPGLQKDSNLEPVAFDPRLAPFDLRSPE
jgi:hypothetical protein